MNQKISVLIIGNEILQGIIQDANGPWLGQYLRNKGHDLYEIRVQPDSVEELLSTLSDLSQSCETLIISGGLGPTDDDITKTALAKFFDLEIRYHEETFKMVNDHYARLDKEFKPHQNKYDQFPHGMTPLYNSVGLAPGIFYKKDKFQIIALPGVPREFQKMLDEHSNLFLSTRDIMREKLTIKTFRVPEEKIFNELCPGLWEDLSQYGDVSSLPHLLGVDIGVNLSPEIVSNKRLVDHAKNEIINIIEKSEIHKHVWQIGDLSIEELIIKIAKDKKITFGFTESCTGGLTSSTITNISGSSEVFFGGIVSYDNSVKMRSLNVKEKTLEDFGAVSTQTADEMAEGGRNHLGVDICISFTGIAGPGGGSPEKPVGTVAIGISTKDKTDSKIYNFKGSRLQLKERFMKQGLHILLDELKMR